MRHQQGRNEQLTPTGERRCSNQTKIIAEIVDLIILTQEKKTAENGSAAESTCRYCRKKGHFERVCRKKAADNNGCNGQNRVQEPDLYHDLAKGTTVIIRKDRRIVQRSTPEKVNLHVGSTMKIKTMFIKHPASKQKLCPSLK